MGWDGVEQDGWDGLEGVIECQLCVHLHDRASTKRGESSVLKSGHSASDRIRGTDYGGSRRGSDARC